ncbi:ABC transporter permease [Angustibacter sp. McL0619]|uniref:ABC transporter permease n=1 Tax=Angustibacter sp. McL0619 TaxID=3415676 RepID=UPI003CEA8CF7
MRAYLELARAGFGRYSTYRMASVAGALTNTIFGVVKASIVLAAIASAGGAIAGYDAQQGATYSWLCQALVATVGLFGWRELADRIRTGDVAVDLARPLDLQLSGLAADLGRGAYMLLPRGLPPLIVGFVFFPVGLPHEVQPYLLAAVSIPLAVAVSYACRFMVNLVAFWLLDVRGALTLYVVASNVLSGLIVPVAWFPGWMGAIAAATPFPSMLQAPVDVLSGRVRGWDAVGTVAIQAAWLAGTLLLGRVVLARATRKLVVQGG